MPIEQSDLMCLALRKRPHLQVGELPRPVATYLACSPGVVYLGAAELHHIANKHMDIRQEEVQHLFLMISRGCYFRVKGRPNCVTIYWRMPEAEKPYLVGLKAANSGEVWVQTMYRTTPRKAANKTTDDLLLWGTKD